MSTYPDRHDHAAQAVKTTTQVLLEIREAAERARPSTADAHRASVFPPGPRRPTPQEEANARGERVRQAWAATRERIKDWPADLAARELSRVRQQFGAEPGSGATAEALADRIGRPAAPEPLEVRDAATRGLLRLLGHDVPEPPAA